MVRETNCSLTAFNTAYMPSQAFSNPSYTDQSYTLNYEQVIHSAAGLTTTPDQFAGGCTAPNIGTASNNLIYVGLTPSGMRVGALANGMGAHAHLYTVVFQTGGTFVSATTQPDPPNGALPLGAVSGDLTGNGINDLITVNWIPTGGASVTVYLGKTDGSFTVGQTYTIQGTAQGLGAQSAVLDDFNGDGKLDLVVPSGNDFTGVSQLTFLPGNGDGTFGKPITMTVNGTFAGFGSLADGLVSGDFNNDGKKDLVGGYGLVFLGNGDGTFTQLADPGVSDDRDHLRFLCYLASGDFNKDGKLDIAVGERPGDCCVSWQRRWHLHGGQCLCLDQNNGYLTATDLDGDGNLDLYSGDATNGIFGGDPSCPNMGYALMGNGDGTFRGAPRAAGTGTAYAYTSPFQTMEDLNGDGRLDYVALTHGALGGTQFNMQTYLGNGDGTFNLGAALPISPFTYNGTAYQFQGIDSYVLMDVNADGHLDLLVLPGQYYLLNPPRPGYLLALGNADGSFQAPTFVPFPSLIPGGGSDYIWGVAGLFTAKAANGTPELLYSFETQDFNPPNNYYVGYATQLSNGNGTLAAPATTDIYTATVPPTFQAPTPALNLVDVNGDKTPDLITFVAAVFGTGGVQLSPPEYQLFLGNSNGTFGAAKTLNLVDTVLHYSPMPPVTVADVNGDNIPDLLVVGGAPSGNGEIGIALGNGDGTFKAPTKILLSTFSGGQNLDVAKFTGSGHADLVIMGFNPPYDTGLFPGNGNGTFQTLDSGAGNGTVIPPQPINIVATGSTVVADINGDGKPDIAGTTFLINNYSAPATPAASNTALQASSTSITGGQSVTLTATVAALSGSVTPAGTVAFLSGSTPLGTETLSTEGIAVLDTSALPVGSDSITARYSGDANFLGSSASTSVTITVAGPSSNTALASSLNPSQAGQSVTITATVTSTAGTPAGTVTFKDGAATLGLRTLDAGAQATFRSSLLAVGTHSITAIYAGSPSFGPSTSTALSQVVNPAGAPAAPVLLSLSPGIATAGSAPFTLTVNGENFVSNSVVLWNGQARATTYMSTTKLQATIPASDIQTQDTAVVTVANPTATSAGLLFAVQSAVPVIMGASLADAPAAGGNYMLTLTGINFMPTSTVKWGTSTLASTTVNPLTITAVVPPADYASRPATVTVSNSSNTSLGFEVH